MPDEVDSWPVQWSGGWLLQRVIELEAVIRGDKKWDDGIPVGFGLDDPDWDPMLAGIDLIPEEEVTEYGE